MSAEKVENDLVIQGIIKEALFHQAPFRVHTDSGAVSLRVRDITEARIRDESSLKKIQFQGAELEAFVIGRSYVFEASFYRCLIQGEMSFAGEQGGRLLFEFPKTLTLKNQRRSQRADVGAEEARAVPVFLQSGSECAEGSFSLEDTSAEGYGGRLVVLAGFPVEPGTHIGGRLGFSESVADLRGQVVSVVRLPEDRGGFDSYRVGIRQDLKQAPRGSVRQRTRHAARLQLTLESLLHRGQKLSIDVEEVSVNGFSGRRSAGSAVSSVPIGSSFEVPSEKMRVRLVHVSSEKMHFQITARSTGAGIEWLKRITPFVHHGARADSQDAKELYRVFLQAGAVSGQYLNRHQLHPDLLIDSGRVSDCVHRWFIGGDATHADSYISAIRMGNSSWVFGDIAKVSASDVNGRDTIRNFFRSFSEFALIDDSISNILICWVQGHPLWQEWQSRLGREHSNLISSQTALRYFRFTEGPQDQSGDGPVGIQRIRKEDYSLRRELLETMDRDVRTLLRQAFDFEESGAGSCFFSHAVAGFERDFAVVTEGGNRFLAILTRVPAGLSINRFVDSLFLVPLDEFSRGESFEDQVLRIGRRLSAEFQLVFPAVRVIHTGNLPEGGTEMTCLLLYPRAFLYF